VEENDSDILELLELLLVNALIDPYRVSQKPFSIRLDDRW
jgi:hypothetical protein